MSTGAALESGLVVAAHGRHCLVEADDGSRRICHPRGKKSQSVVGDRVRWLRAPPGQGEEGTIERVEPRRNLLYRQDEIRTKSFAANLDQVLILIAAEPEFSERQLARVLIAAEAERIEPLIVLNKSDLGELFARAWERLAPYRAMGYRVAALSLKELSAQPGTTALSVADLAQHLEGKTTLVLGPSGAGKSTLINRLVPTASALTQEISRALNSGKHTTTSTTWYWVGPDRSTGVIDSPGFQEFGLHQVDPHKLADLMPDLRAHIAQCRFYNCTHLHEPGCGVIAAVARAMPATTPVTSVTPVTPVTHATADGAINERRYSIYRDLFAELSQPQRY